MYSYSLSIPFDPCFRKNTQAVAKISYLNDCDSSHGTIIQGLLWSSNHAAEVNTYWTMAILPLFLHRKMNSPGNEYACSPFTKNPWPWWTSLSESKKRLMTSGNHDWVLDRTLLVATWVPWPQAWHSPAPVEKGAGRKLSFEHLTSCGHSHENHKYVYVYIHILASMIWEDAKCKEIPIHQTIRCLQRPCHASIVPRRHPPCKITRCGVFPVSWDHHFKSAWLKMTKSCLKLVGQTWLDAPARVCLGREERHGTIAPHTSSHLARPAVLDVTRHWRHWLVTSWWISWLHTSWRLQVLQILMQIWQIAAIMGYKLPEIVGFIAF